MSLANAFQPLYKQVYNLLTERIVCGELKPSESLPSEQALAKELGVSQGTVRKALNQMVAENLLKRRQGKGTYVTEHTEESSLFRFFRFREPGGDSIIPQTRVLSRERRVCNEQECMHLNLKPGELVVEMHRLRSLQGEAVIDERIIQPLSIFPDIDLQPKIPNFLYTLYQEKFGISIVEVHEELRAISAPEDSANNLGLAVGEPVLCVERASINIDGRVVEWSQALCKTEHFVYAANLK